MISANTTAWHSEKAAVDAVAADDHAVWAKETTWRLRD
jgi:hypothetical protein